MRLLSVIARPAGVLLCLAGLAGTLTAAPAALPIAPVRDVTQVLHGVTVHDPYRYLENVKDPEVQAWLRAQGEGTRQTCLLYTSPSPRDRTRSRMPSSA